MAAKRSIDFRALLLLEDALDRPSDEREAWVRSSTDDTVLAERVLSFLRTERDALSAMRTGGAAGVHADAPLPERIGAYRVTGLIGQGGMGAVYRGERDSGDFEHVAAIKVVKPGILAERLVERFRDERQTLARLTHPNIARLLDGGATEEGVPYIVMEYVDGVPLLDWAESRQLGLEDRLQLFLQVCEAVAYAHQNLIVHRDITPTNVLVTRDGIAKLIDFGISRLHEEGDEGETPSRSGLPSRSMTPGYAAPERAAGGGVNTLADVYSLGKLLQALLGDAAGDPDLASIAARASAVRPEARYATANALAQDIGRFRRGEPVQARDGGAAYRLRKFVSRRRYAVAAATAFVLLLLTALALTTRAYTQADLARADAERRFEDLRALAKFQIFELYDDLTRVAGNNRPRARLTTEAQRYLRLLAAHPGATAEVRLETAQGFLRLARIQGMPNEPNLKDYDGARRSISEAEVILARLDREMPNNPALVPTIVTALVQRALLVIYVDQRLDDGERIIGAAARRLAAVPQSGRGEAWMNADRLVRLTMLELREQQGKSEELIALTRRFEADIDRRPAAMRHGPLADRDRAAAQYFYGSANLALGRAEQAVTHFRQARTRLAEIDAKSPNDPWVLYTKAWSEYLGYAAAKQAKLSAQAAALVEEAVRTATRLRALQEGDGSIVRLLLNVREARARNLATRGRLDEALREQADVVKEQHVLARSGRPSSVSSLAFSESVLGTLSLQAGRREAACANWRQAEQRMARLDKEGRLTVSFADLLPRLRNNLGQCEANGPAGAFVPVPAP